MSRRQSKHQRSFRRRQGHITRAQRRALRELWPRFGLTFEYNQRLDLRGAFGRDAHQILEIGFGTGDCLAEAAALWPERDILGLEVHLPGIGAALQKLETQDLTNARVVRGDAVEVLAHHLAPASLDEIWIFFPDPFPRRQDRERRLISADLMPLLTACARPGAVLRVATDIEDYAVWALDVLENASAWRNCAESFAPRPEWRPITMYEQKAREAGRKVYDLCFALKDAPEPS